MLRFLLRLLGRGLAVLAWLGLFAVSAYLAFNLFVRGGVTAVPDLAGMPEEEARRLLADQGLALGRRDDPAYTAEVPIGMVAAQEPGAGSLVKRGSAVVVALSAGAPQVSIPDLRGQPLPAAQVTLAAAGLALGRMNGVVRLGAAPGTVVEQDPSPGARSGGVAAVDLLFALDASEPSYVMPDLVYRQYDDVRAFFSGRGFRLGSVKFEPYEGIVAGVVLRQFPLAGHPLRRRDTISLVVAAQGVAP